MSGRFKPSMGYYSRIRVMSLGDVRKLKLLGVPRQIPDMLLFILFRFDESGAQILVQNLVLPD